MKRNVKRVICLFLATIIVVTTVEYAPPSFALTAISNSKTEGPGKPYGSMYQNEITPDGYLVDENEVWKIK
ncbi:MAG: hypothetical protein E7248_17990 [Paenibacillaceae bacterium]|nr:hypothetical protein [Paenibacillaceae bacterium]